jgi:hypothetical protein
MWPSIAYEIVDNIANQRLAFAAEEASMTEVVGPFRPWRHAADFAWRLSSIRHPTQADRGVGMSGVVVADPPRASLEQDQLGASAWPPSTRPSAGAECSTAVAPDPAAQPDGGAVVTAPAGGR